MQSYGRSREGHRIRAYIFDNDPSEAMTDEDEVSFAVT